MSKFINYRGRQRNVIAFDPDDIVYPKKITPETDFHFIGWKKWLLPSYRNSTGVEYLPLELGRLLRYKIITREQHKTLINMLRSEDEEDVYVVYKMLDALKNQRHNK